jgi:hypothetical protein
LLQTVPSRVLLLLLLLLMAAAAAAAAAGVPGCSALDLDQVGLAVSLQQQPTLRQRGHRLCR